MISLVALTVRLYGNLMRLRPHVMRLSMSGCTRDPIGSSHFDVPVRACSGTLGVLRTMRRRVHCIAIGSYTAVRAVTLQGQRVNVLKGRLVLEQDLVIRGIGNLLHRFLLEGTS